ncbi:hypothetical protein [Anaerotignum sp. MB30-C6]|uniref:hypothetical protein n=1 Tax=Anaerotignum sp. MB30-C6 TaxID=3070814 RepID=UPI0027DB6E27|nr:hypothetical protein [Anaerotignum sp. MB30-C6]WMI80890.1 hypothetical protein RBQ60_13885 [Anaerotignum sp. MB30-C6]
MTWEIALGIFALLGFVIALVKPIVSLTQVITRLNSNFEALTKEFREFNKANRNEHKELWDHNAEQDKLLRDHGQRLHDLDGK